MSTFTTQESEDDLLQPPLAGHPRSSSAAEFANIPPAPVLTRYIIKINNQPVAGGAFGDVYKCRYVNGSTSEEVAVKALRYSADEDARKKYDKMARRELGVWKRLSHENIVPFLGIAYGFGINGAMSLVSLWMPNETLPRFLKTHDDKLIVVHRLQILLDVSKGLDYLHSLQIVHGDLNSNNVLLDADYTARVADFGYASLAGNIPEALTYLQRSTNRPGALRWTAPEQIDPQETFCRTTKSDIYSFGCIALQGSALVLSGKQPWSEVPEDHSVVLRLSEGRKPGRPKSRKMGNSHWNFIQCCWSGLQERPRADTIVLRVQQFLNDCPPCGPLRDLFISPISRRQDSLVMSPVDLAPAPSHSLPGATSPTLGPSNSPPRDRPSNTKSAEIPGNSSILHVPHVIQNGASPPIQTTETSNKNTSVLDKKNQKRYPRIRVPLSIASKFLASLWNRVRRSSSPTMCISENDIVIFVIGPAGSGKSWFTRVATTCDTVRVHKDQHISTGNIQAIWCKLTEGDERKADWQAVKNIIFVDTPSFFTGHDHPDPHKEFRTWFGRIPVYQPRFVGMIYMHRASVNPTLAPTIRDHLQELTRVPQFHDARPPLWLHVVMSYDQDSTLVHQPKLEERISDLRTQVDLLSPRAGRWKVSMHLEIFQGEPKVAWNAVEELLRGS